jgi:acyl carrier protein
MRPIETEIRQFIVESFLFGEDDPGLDNDDSLLDNGVIDSTGVLELVAFLEKQFQIQVADMELIPENLDSVQRIAQFVQRKQSTQGAHINAT